MTLSPALLNGLKTAALVITSFVVVITIWTAAVGDLEFVPKLFTQAAKTNTTGETYAWTHSLEKAPVNGSWEAWPGWENIHYAFVFGDGYSDTWFEPAGDQPNVQFSFGNTARIFHGSEPPPPKWPNFLLQQHNETDFIFTYNLAVAGAPIGEPEVDLPDGNIRSFRSQVLDQFVDRYGKVDRDTAWSKDDTIFIVWAGAEDIAASFDAGIRPNISKHIDSYADNLEELYDQGARHFLLMNLPPIEIAEPSNSNISKVIRKSDIADFNAQLVRMRNMFMQSHQDATAHLFDTRSLWTHIILNPLVNLMTQHLHVMSTWCLPYAVAQTTDPNFFNPFCQEPIGRYFWTDQLHVSLSIHQVTAAFVALDCFSSEKPRGYCS